MDCCNFSAAAEQKFDAKRAAQDLAQYRRKGPNPTTILLRDGLAGDGRLDGSLLDVGAGVGALTFELLDRGIGTAIAVEASSAYLAAASQEADRRGRTAATQFVHGDFLNVASGLPAATVVTLDRVICCHPAYEAMLAGALRLARRHFAFSYPRNQWYVRATLAIENAFRRLASNPFRAFVHRPDHMERIIKNAGFKLTRRRQTLAWCADVYVRTG